MIICDINDAERYSMITPLLAEAITWLGEHRDDDFPTGVIELASGIIIKSEAPALLPREKARLEAHRKYIDIHVPLKGVETIGWTPVRSLKHVLQPYDEQRDVAFYGDAAASLLDVAKGQMAIFFPEDAHAPNIGIGTHRKLCIKIPC